jgi:hypothetical protein
LRDFRQVLEVAEHFLYRGLDVAAHGFHAGGRDLADDDVPVPIEHQARKPIRFTEHDAVVRRAVKTLAQCERDLHAMHEQRLVERPLGVPAHDARADERVRIHIRVAEELVAIRMHRGERARLEARERRRGGVDFVAEDPEVARADAAIFATFELENRQGERGPLGYIGRPILRGRLRWRMPIASLGRRVLISSSTPRIQSTGIRGARTR